MLYRNYRSSFCFFLDLCDKTRLLSISVAIGLRQIHQPFVTQDKIEEAFELKMKMTELRRERRASCSLQKYKFLFKVSKNKNNSFSNVSRVILFDRLHVHVQISYILERGTIMKMKKERKRVIYARRTQGSFSKVCFRYEESLIF